MIYFLPFCYEYVFFFLGKNNFNITLIITRNLQILQYFTNRTKDTKKQITNDSTL